MEIEGPRPSRHLFTPAPLDGLGVVELEAYRQDLQREITRIEAEIERKDAHKRAAAAFFKPRP
jgi:uncharacterized small protein (DUF1192 family)